MTVVVNSFSINWDELCKESCKIVGLEVILLRLEAVPNVYDMNSLQLEYLRCDVLLLLGRGIYMNLDAEYYCMFTFHLKPIMHNNEQQWLIVRLDLAINSNLYLE